MSVKKLRPLAIAAVAAAAVAGLALPVTAGTNGYVKAWPTLSVAKALAPEKHVDATGPFTVTVTCDYPQEVPKAEVNGGPMVTTLVFNPDGTPQSASVGGWVNDGKTWSYTGSALKNKQCTVEETGKANAVSVSYACTFSSVPFEQPNGVIDEGYYDVEPGCAEAGPSATPAVVQFGSPWDRSCVVPDETTTEGGTQCQQSALVTVTNTLPELKSEIVQQVPLQPNFPG